MNLKDAFRAQNKLQSLMDEAGGSPAGNPCHRAQRAWRNGGTVTAGSGADE